MDAAAFTAIVATNRRRLHGYARRMVGDSRADDVVQTALLAAWLQVRAGVEIREPMPWLFTCVKNTALNALKAAPARNEGLPLLDWMPDRSDPAAEVELADELRRALIAVVALPSRQRDALLAAASGSSSSQVAADMGLTGGAARILLHRARTSVREAA